MANDPDWTETIKAKSSWAWGLCWLLFASTVLNYMDRQAISVVGERITKEFQIRFEDFGWVLTAFQLPYALFQVPAGFLADRWDVRPTYAIAVIWWSLAAIAVAWSPTLGALMIFRALLGLGESFNWPCALKVTATVLPPADRSLGNGIFNSGAAVGAVLTPLIVTPLTILLGWRFAFALIGAVGLVWVAVWLFVVNGPARPLFQASTRPEVGSSSRLPDAARWAFGILGIVAVAGGLIGARLTTTVDLPVGQVAAWKVEPGAAVRKGETIAEGGEGVKGVSPIASPMDGTVAAVSGTDRGVVTLRYRPLGLSAYWLAIAFLMIGSLVVARLIPLDRLGTGGLAAGLGEIVRLRRFWVLVVVSVSVNVCWHFLVNWLPTYLKTDRGMEFKVGSLLSALPFLAADVGNLGGGAASRWLSRWRGMSVANARAAVLGVCVLLIASGAGVGSIRDNGVVVALLAVMALGTAAFMANYFAYCQDVSPSRTGLVVGILGGLGNLFAAGFNPIAGRIKDTSGGFGVVFLIVGLLPFVGLAAILIGWGRSPEPAGETVAANG